MLGLYGILVFLLIITSGCNAISNSSDSTESDELLFSEYPLSVGNYWNYDLTYYDGDTLTGNITVHVTQEVSISNSVDGFQMTEEMFYGLFQHTLYQSNQESGLYLYPFSDELETSFFNLFKKVDIEKSKQFLFKNRYFKSAEDFALFSLSSIPTFNETPITVLKYPLELNSEWSYIQRENSAISKRVVGKETISLPCGVFECYKIQWLRDFDNDGEWDDDIEEF